MENSTNSTVEVVVAFTGKSGRRLTARGRSRTPNACYAVADTAKAAL